MKLILSLTFSLIINEASWAKGAECHFRISGLKNVVAEGNGDDKYDAHAAAVEKCVDLRVEDYQARNGTVGEDLYSLFIDKCTIATCEK